jgi:hypothetical protein
MVEIPQGIRVKLTQIARQGFTAVQYDRQDPHAAAIEACAAELGLTASPADSTPRMIRGAYMTERPPSPRGAAALAQALHDVLCRPVSPDPGPVPCDVDPTVAEALLIGLAAAGWRLVADAAPFTPTPGGMLREPRTGPQTYGGMRR